MTAKQPVEFTKKTSLGNELVGNEVLSSSKSMTPDTYIYEFLRRVSGPASASGNNWDMDTVSNITPSVFQYTIPKAKTFRWMRINVELVDGAMQSNRFGGIGTLANGCLLQVVDTNGTTILQNFGTDVQPIQRNADFGALAGVDNVIQPAAGDDMLPVRFSIFKAGAPMELTAGRSIRWTNQDDLSGLTVFRIMAQGIIS